MQWLYEATARNFEAGNKKIMELGMNIAKVISQQHHQHLGQLENVRGAFGAFGEKFSALYKEVV